MNDELKDMHVDKNTIRAEIQKERALKEALERENRLLEEELVLSKEASSNFKRSESGKSKAAGALEVRNLLATGEGIQINSAYFLYKNL